MSDRMAGVRRAFYELGRSAALAGIKLNDLLDLLRPELTEQLKQQRLELDRWADDGGTA